jgi:hypothetical protein
LLGHGALKLSLAGGGTKDLARRGAKASKMGPAPKINLQKTKNFQAPKMTVKITTFTTHFTTHLPSKNHVLHTVFCKTPCKNEVLPRIKKSAQQQFV